MHKILFLAVLLFSFALAGGTSDKKLLSTLMSERITSYQPKTSSNPSQRIYTLSLITKAGAAQTIDLVFTFNAKRRVTAASIQMPEQNFFSEKPDNFAYIFAFISGLCMGYSKQSKTPVVNWLKQVYSDTLNNGFYRGRTTIAGITYISASNYKDRLDTGDCKVWVERPGAPGSGQWKNYCTISK